MNTIPKSFLEILKIGLGGSYYKLFIDPLVLLYIIIDSYLGFLTVNLSNTLIGELSNYKVNICSVIFLIFLPLITNSINILFDKVILEKKIFVVNNILNYIKRVFLDAPHEFHDKYNIVEKNNCFTSSIWGFDNLVSIIISMCSSFIKIMVVSINISMTNYDIGILLLMSNILLLYVMPKINLYLEKFKDKDSHKQFYASAYYETLIFEENRINPILEKIQTSDVNNSLSEIVKRYSNMNKSYFFGNMIRSFIKNILLSIILIVAFYQKKYSYLMIILLNRSIIFGFSDFYEEFKKTENSNKKNMEDLIEMFEFLEDYYLKNNKIEVIVSNINPKILTLNNMEYNFYYDNDLKKKLSCGQITFDFINPKNIILISGKTGSGKSLFTKILSGQTDLVKYDLINNGKIINSFAGISNNRIVINQKISEEYTFNGGIKLSIEKLYPSANSFEEIEDYLRNFGIHNKINKKKLTSDFADKLSGGERQRVAISSMIWKTLKTNPSYIIIDEPEKGVDEDTMISIMDWIIKTYKGLIFLITHNETIKKKYYLQIQSIIKYKFLDEEEIDTIIYQEIV